MTDDSWLLTGPTAPDEVRRRYDEWAGEYDQTLQSWGYDAPSRAVGLFLSRLPDGDGGPVTILDAGCGTGLVGAALRRAGVRDRIVGVDLSAASLDIARGRAVYDELTEVDLQQPLPFADHSFGGALCVGVLSYVPDTASIWRELARVVRPSGVVVCTQRSDVWDERRCDVVLDELERDGTWAVTHLRAPSDYMPGNPEFGHAIGVRYLAARVRT
jgi:SAM-dependent methyltransferase